MYDYNTSLVKTKVCSKCKQALPTTTEYFWRDKTKKDGLGSQCKMCRNPEPKDRIPEGYKKCTKCKEVLLATNDMFCRKKNGKYGLDSRCKKCDAEYRKKNKERIKNYHKSYYVENKEKISKRNSNWNKKNRNNGVKRKQRSRARKQKLPATLTEKQWVKIKSDFNYECAYCGMTEEQHFELYSEQLHQEHFIPLSDGGGYTHNNIIPACRSCNSSKHDENFFEWYSVYQHYSRRREKKILEYLSYTDDGIQQLNIL